MKKLILGCSLLLFSLNINAEKWHLPSNNQISDAVKWEKPKPKPTINKTNEIINKEVNTKPVEVPKKTSSILAKLPTKKPKPIKSSGDSTTKSNGKDSSSNQFNCFWPTKKGGVTSRYGWRNHPVLRRRIFHKGVDLQTGMNANIYAAENGTVVSAGWKGGYGKTVVIKHVKGYSTLYAHLNDMKVRRGQKIKRGQMIALSGRTGRVTGPHLHFEIRKNGRTLDPLRYKS